MPPRLSKRQQREKEEIEALASAVSPQEEYTSDEGTENKMKPVSTTAPKKSAFSLLADTAIVSEHSEEDDQSKVATNKKKGKKKKKAPSQASPAPSTPKSPPVAKPGSNKKGKKQAKPEDDLDRALAELSLKYSDITIPDPSLKPAAPALTSALQSFRSLISLQPKYLDADAEMRKFFGSKVISAAEASSSSSAGYQPPRGPIARSVLCKPQKTWPPAGLRDGLSMRQLKSEEIRGDGGDKQENWMVMPGDKWFTVEHSPGYRWDQAQFMQAVRMMDPNNLFALMQESWYHVDTLLQIAEVYRHQDDYSVSSDFTARALFAYERTFTGAFNLTNGASRLDFRKIENRSLFLALHRTILYLERRGTMRTAFEYARSLWSLDPWNDPHGALMHLDFLIIKAEQYDWFMDIENTWEGIRNEVPSLLPLDVRPGWKWSKALALKVMGTKKGGGEKRATEELKSALVSFPEVLVALSQLITISIPSSARLPSLLSRWSRSDEQTSTLWLLAQTYAHRSVSLWKIPETLDWLNSTLQSVASELTPKPKASTPFSPRFIKSIIRHAIVSDAKALAPFIGSIMSAIGPQEGYDIVPPDGEGATVYDDQYFSSASAETSRKRREGMSAGGRGRMRAQAGREGIEVDPVDILETLEAALALNINDERRNHLLRVFEQAGAAWVRHLERWVRDHAEFANQYPNAAAFLRQPAAQRPRPVPVVPDADVPELEVAGPFVGPIPGAFAGDAIEQQEAEEGSTDDENDVPILPVRIARRLVGMLWGGGTPENDADTDSDDDHVDHGPQRA